MKRKSRDIWEKIRDRYPIDGWDPIEQKMTYILGEAAPPLAMLNKAPPLAMLKNKEKNDGK